MSITINLVYEDELSGFVIARLLNSFGKKFCIGTSYIGRGFGNIKKNIRGYNQAAIATAFFVLTDLDNNKCPVGLIKDWIKDPIHPNLLLRVAVKEVEAWLLADIEAFSTYIGVAAVNFPPQPELEPDPKRTLISLVRKSRKRAIREDIVPINDNAKVGPAYNQRLMEFVMECWDPLKAFERSDSLKRAYNSLERYRYISPILL